MTEITGTTLFVQMTDDFCRTRGQVETDERAELPLENVCAHLRLCHAMCYYTVQGSTIRDRHIVLLDTSHKHFSVKSLFVGLSRATHGQYLHVGDSTSEGVFCGERRVRQTAARLTPT